MKDIIEEYKKGEPKEKFKLLKSMLRVLSGTEDFNLNKAFEVLLTFKNEMNKLEDRVFSSNINHKELQVDL